MRDPGSGPSLPADSGPAAPGPRVSVVGVGRVEVAPDSATVSVSIEAIRPTATAAREEAARLADAVLAALEAAGVDAADRRTAGIEVQPWFAPDAHGAHRRAGFQVVHRVAAIARDTDAIGSILDVAIEAGATGVDAVELGVIDRAGAEAEARTRAVLDARQRAEAIAAAAGSSLGGLVELVEGGPAGPPTPMPHGARFALAAEALPTPIAAGRLEVVVRVAATWELR